MFPRTKALMLTIVLAALAGCRSSSNTPMSTVLDTVAPIVSSTNPIDGATGVAVITASFNELMNPSTITATSFELKGPGATTVSGTVTYTASTGMAEFRPVSALTPGTAYTATITTGATDLSGNALATNRVWTFTTSAVAGNALAPALGGAARFVVLGGSTVTNTGSTRLTGDVGVSPGSAVTGFPPGLVTGEIYAANPTSALGMADLTTAYNDAAGRTVAPITIAGNLGGLTLPPGLYKSTSSVAISSSNLTLDAKGDANAVFIFQVASTLTTTSGRAVILIGSAKASNVFWQVGTSATLGTTSAFKGTIMANQSITLNTGATLTGRALARIGAVALAANAAVLPTP